MTAGIALAAALAVVRPAAAQTPAQTPPPAPTASIPDWQRPNIEAAEYAAGAERDLDEKAARLAEMKQRAGERRAGDLSEQLEQVEKKLYIAREHWDKLLQVNEANWPKVRKDFEMAYEDLSKAWRKLPQQP